MVAIMARDYRSQILPEKKFSAAGNKACTPELFPSTQNFPAKHL
jgi:hypothetical protein